MKHKVHNLIYLINRLQIHGLLGRLDGTFCSIDEADKKSWLKELSTEHDIINFEMEAPLFLAFCRRAGIPSAIMCAAMLNRFDGDQVTTPKGTFFFEIGQ